MAYTTIDDPSAYFKVQLYTGTGSTHAITFNDTDTDMQPDLIWNKSRVDTYSHNFCDSVRGVTKMLEGESTSAENTNTNAVTAFGSDGFTVGSDNGNNKSSSTFVAWCWKAGTTGSGTTSGSGSGKAYSYSVSTTAGISIVKYIGNGTSAHTIPHHLGAVPQWVLIKETSNSSDWMGYHVGKGNTHTIKLNEPDAPVDRTDWWNDTTPTSSVVTLGDNGEINQDDTDYVMYSFSNIQGYSKFDSYTGNGNADGIFIYTGFRPAFIMYKNTARSASWLIHDNKRLGYNPNNDEQHPDTNAADGTDDRTDILSNGFKIREDSAILNTAGEKVIYMAFAEAPFANSNGVPANAR